MSKTEPKDEIDGQNYVLITEDHKPDWTYDSTKELLKQFDEKIDMLDTGILSTQKKMWQLVSKEMVKNNYYFTPAQCENKWKTLKRTYKAKQERVDRFGSAKRQCPFENEIAEIISKRPQEAMGRRVQDSPPRPKIPKPDTTDDDIFNINLNNPPGFDGENDNSSLLGAGNASYVLQESGPLVEELSQLRDIVTKSSKFQAQMMKNTNDFQQKILRHLDYAAQRESNSLKLQQARIEQQNEIIKQMRVHNTLLEKLLDKIG